MHDGSPIDKNKRLNVRLAVLWRTSVSGALLARPQTGAKNVNASIQRRLSQTFAFEMERNQVKNVAAVSL
jgi:hypothetical protein